MIAEALAGKRIAITGATGFVGTALVERLLRGVPGLRAGAARPGRQAHDGRPSGSAARSSRTTPSTACARELGERRPFDAMVARAGRRSIAGDVSTDGLGLDDAGRAALGQLRHRHPLGRRGGVRLAARRRRRGQPARPDAHRRHAATTLGVTPHLVAVSTCYVAGNRRGAAPEELVSDGPFDLGARLARGGRRRPAAAQRRRGREPPARRSSTDFRQRGPPRARRRRRAGAGRQDRAAARALGAATSWSRPAGPGPPASAGPTPTPTPRRSASRRSTETKGDVPVSHRAPVDHRVGAGRAEPGLDPRLPHGRAGDHLLRPRPAEGVPRRPRGHRRRHPGRPRRRRHHRRRRARPGAGAARSPRSPSGCGQPAASTGRWSTTCSDWFSEHPLYDAEGQPIVRARVAFPGRGRVQGQLEPGQDADRRGPRGCCRRCRCGASRRRWAAKLEERKAEVERALEYVELYGAYTECEAIYQVDHLLALCGRRSTPTTSATFGFDPRVDRLAARTSPRSTCRRSSQHARVKTTPGKTPHRPRRPAAPPGARRPSATSPRSTSRTR